MNKYDLCDDLPIQNLSIMIIKWKPIVVTRLKDTIIFDNLLDMFNHYLDGFDLQINDCIFIRNSIYIYDSICNVINHDTIWKTFFPYIFASVVPGRTSNCSFTKLRESVHQEIGPNSFELLGELEGTRFSGDHGGWRMMKFYQIERSGSKCADSGKKPFQYLRGHFTPFISKHASGSRSALFHRRSLVWWVVVGDVLKRQRAVSVDVS